MFRSNTEIQNTLALLFITLQCVLHIFYTAAANDPRLIVPAAIAFLHDVTLIIIALFTAQAVVVVIPGAFKKHARIFFSIALISLGMMLALYPKMLQQYLIFPVNIFESDAGTAAVFLSEYAGYSALLPSMLALILGVSVMATTKTLYIPRRTAIIGSSIIFLTFGFTLQRPSPHPFVYTLQKTIESALKNEKRIVPSLKWKYFPDSSIVELKQLQYSGSSISNYDHILFVVLEGVTSDAFEKEFLSIPDGFFQRNISRSVYYNNYYATNLDSYTSLISMVTSLQVPYRAYADESLYGGVNTAPNFAEDLKNKGFKNFFISTYEYQPFIPARNYWENIYERNSIPSIDQWISLGSNRMESATEDKAAISTIVGTMRQNKKTFILHEMVYGHSPEWRATTGKTQLSYYNEYLTDLSAALRETNQLKKVLFVIVSDHGDRSKSFDLDNYRVPLLVVGDHVAQNKAEGLFNHLDLPRLVYHYFASDKYPETRKEIFFVGSTEKWVYGKMNRQKEYLFINDQSGTVLSMQGSMDPVAVHNEFQRYVYSFSKRYGNHQQ